MGGLCAGRAGFRKPHPRGDGRHLQRAANLLAHPAGQGGRFCREPPARSQAAGHLPDRSRQGDRQAQSRRRRSRQGRHRDDQGRQGVLQPRQKRGDSARHGHQPQNHQTAGDGAPLRRHQRILPGVQRRMGQRHNTQRLPAASRRRLHPGPLLLPLNVCVGRDRRNRHRGAGRHEVPARHGGRDEQARPAHQMDNTSRIPGCTEIYG